MVSKKQEIYVVRHCEATGQASDCPLTEKGQLQANDLTKFFEGIHIDKIISSHFTRAIHSIEPLANQLDIEITVENNLSERVLSSDNLPGWLDCLEKTFDDFNLTYLGGESNNEAMGRAKSVLEKIFKEENKAVLVVTHGNLMTLILRSFNEQFGFEEWKNLTNPDVFKITLGNEPMVERVWKG